MFEQTITFGEFLDREIRVTHIDGSLFLNFKDEGHKDGKIQLGINPSPAKMLRLAGVLVKAVEMYEKWAGSRGR